MNSTVDHTSDDICSRPLFNLVNQAKSTQTTYMFIGLLTFSIMVETLIEYVEEKAQGTVIPQVLQKVYKELMLLGFVNFAIFIILSNVSASTTTVASFEYADCVMFFVAVGIIGQTMWSIICNQRFQKQIWRACGIDTMRTMEGHLKIMATPLEWESLLFNKRLGLWLREWKASRSFEYAALNLQTFRMIFLTSHNLPDSFPFPHYLSTYLNATTVSFINIQPQSYFVLLVIILLSEFVVRNRPAVLWRSDETVALETSTTFVVFGVFGLILCAIDSISLRTLRKACYKLVFIQLNVGTVEEALVKNFVWASHSKDRTQKSLNTLNQDLKAYLDPRGWRESEIATTFNAAVESGISPTSNSSVDAISSSSNGSLNSRKISKSSSMRSKSPPKQQIQDMDAKAVLAKQKSLKKKSSFFHEMRLSDFLKEEESSTTEVADVEVTPRHSKGKSGVNAMIKQAKSTVAASNRRFSELSRVLKEDTLWVSEDAQRASESAKSLLPFSSLSFVRAAVDALRLLKIFYISVFVTSFMVQSFKMQPVYSSAVWIGFFTVLASNVLIDPSITYHYVLLVTMASVNPLMLADTVDYMNDVKAVKLQVASKMVDLYRRGRRRYSKLNTDVPYTSELSLQDIRLFIIKSFKIWSENEDNDDNNDDNDDNEDGGVFDDKVHSAMMDTKGEQPGIMKLNKGVNRACLAQRLSSARLHLSKRRIDIIFKLADPELTGYIQPEAFFSMVVSAAISEIIGVEAIEGSNTDMECEEDYSYDAENEIDRLKRLSGAWHEEGGLIDNNQGDSNSNEGLISLPQEDALLQEFQRQSTESNVWGVEGKPVDSMAGIFDNHMRKSFMEKPTSVPQSAVSQRTPSTPLAPHSQAIPSPISEDGDREDGYVQDSDVNIELTLSQKTTSTDSSVSSNASVSGLITKKDSLWERTISMEQAGSDDGSNRSITPISRLSSASEKRRDVIKKKKSVTYR